MAHWMGVILLSKGNAVEVVVKLYGRLRQYRPAEAPGAPHHPFSVTIKAGTTAVSLGQQLGIPDGLVAATAVNGEAAALNRRLQEGDQVSLFPPTAGGYD